MQAPVSRKGKMLSALVATCCRPPTEASLHRTHAFLSYASTLRLQASCKRGKLDGRCMLLDSHFNLCSSGLKLFNRQTDRQVLHECTDANEKAKNQMESQSQHEPFPHVHPSPSPLPPPLPHPPNLTNPLLLLSPPGFASAVHNDF